VLAPPRGRNRSCHHPWRRRSGQELCQRCDHSQQLRQVCRQGCTRHWHQPEVTLTMVSACYAWRPGWPLRVQLQVRATTCRPWGVAMMFVSQRPHRPNSPKRRPVPPLCHPSTGGPDWGVAVPPAARCGQNPRWVGRGHPALPVASESTSEPRCPPCACCPRRRRSSPRAVQRPCQRRQQRLRCR